MNHHYRDIRSRIHEAPKWWDENAVPRYCDFAPNESANIYAREVLLLEIQCQGCGAHFDVAMSHGDLEIGWGEDGKAWARAYKSFADRLRELHYGDPPNAGCCAAGPTMNSIPLRVLEFWHAPKVGNWQRRPECEVRIE